MATTLGRSSEAEEWSERAGQWHGAEEARRERLSALRAFYRRARRWAPASAAAGTVGRNSGGGRVLSAGHAVYVPWFGH
jgi:hypothetical protein